MNHWTKRCDQRRVNERAVWDKLYMCQASGIDVDRIPGDITFRTLIRLSIAKIRELTESPCHKSS
jgi:hypothetical protein